MSLYLKGPGARVEYLVDWGAAFLAGAKVAASYWSVEPAEAGGIAVVSAARIERTTAATLEGGISGRLYRVTNHIHLSDGRREERALTIRVDAR